MPKVGRGEQAECVAEVKFRVALEAQNAAYNYCSHMAQAMREIQLRDAKATLSAVVDEAVQGQPSVITRHGKREAVIVSFEEWEKLSHVPSFGRLLMSSPLEPGDIAERQPKATRETGL